MSKYRYQLDKTSKKFHCPQCGKKRFVRYIEIETSNYAESIYGRCDRETSCGYLTYPNNESIIDYNFVAPPPPEPTYMDNEVKEKTLKKYDINPLAIYLIKNRYDKDTVISTLLKYQVGTANMFNGSTIYWQTDHTGNTRTGKVMAYDIEKGKRVKGKFSITWAHKAIDLPNFNLKQCLFGLHLIESESKKIAIVESEKTAIIMSIEIPSETWMATGSLQGFKYEFLAPIKNYEIIAFPDKGGYDKWSDRAFELNSLGFDITVSDYLEQPDFEDGWDLVDVIEYEDKE